MTHAEMREMARSYLPEILACATRLAAEGDTKEIRAKGAELAARAKRQMPRTVTVTTLIKRDRSVAVEVEGAGPAP